MKTVDTFPNPVQTKDNIWIPMPDGTRLSAKLWLPENAGEHPVPAIVEYIPYRKRDGTAIRDSMMHPYLAGHGYACVRVDLRGSGDSEGVLRDEYLEQELHDGEELLAWLARQPWCSGKTAMMGISWGGFNALQIAARQPPSLGAIIALCATDDRYADDVHYMGGCLLGDNLSWASTMFAYNSSPPDPAVVGDNWKEMWLERLEGSGLWLENWLSHQRRDDYWKHGSVSEDFSAIQCPVMAASGWADAYTNAVFRLVENLRVPRLGIVGPWSHKYPHIGIPGPAIGFLQEALKWFDHWLKDKPTDIMENPILRVWMQESIPPSAEYEERPGKWVGESEWPSSSIQIHKYFPAPERNLSQQIPQEVPFTVHSPLSLGQFGGKWCSESSPPDLPSDQREDDGGALVFDSAVLEKQLEVLGPPVVKLKIAADHPVAMVAVRLCDVQKDGKVARVSYGLLNLTHREGHEHPTPLTPGEPCIVSLQLNDIGHIFPPGHRIRISISSSYWPLAWPSPHHTTLTIFTGSSCLELPVRPTATRAQEISFPEAEAAAPLKTTMLAPPENTWRLIRDLGQDQSCLEVIKNRGTIRFDDIDWEMETRATEEYFLRHDDLNSIEGRTHWLRTYRRGEWQVSAKTCTILTSKVDAFKIHAQLDAYDNQERIFSKNWNLTIPRDLV